MSGPRGMIAAGMRNMPSDKDIVSRGLEKHRLRVLPNEDADEALARAEANQALDWRGRITTKPWSACGHWVFICRRAA
jgi:hypothetical protein